MDFRLYDNALGRFFGIDALSEQNHYLSTYQFGDGNPVKYADPSGLSSSVYNWEGPNEGQYTIDGKVVTFAEAMASHGLNTDGTPMHAAIDAGNSAGGGGSNSSFTYDYIFNQNGSYTGTREKNNGAVNRLVIRNTETNETSYYYFADNINDPKDIEEEKIINLVLVDISKVIEMLKDAGAFDSDNGDIWTFYKKSKGTGDFDYVYSTLTKKFDGAGASLFLVKGEYYAHNFHNFGNFLWGATGYTLGFDFSDLQIGGHINSLFNPRSNGYSSQWDSKDDQLSITKGVFFALKNLFRNLVDKWKNDWLL